MPTAEKRRSPIPPPPRIAGESGEEHFYFGYLIPLAILMGMAFATVLVAMYEWLWFFLGRPLGPGSVTIMAVLLTTTVIALMFRHRDEARRIMLGVRGERTVAALLATLDGYRVIHDLPIGPAGLFAIETKTRTKPPKGRGRATVTYDGTKILVDGHAPDRDPSAQAQASARYVRDVIRQRTGLNIAVRPVVLFPGWWVECPSGVETWVLNEKKFLTWLRTEERIAKEQSRTLTPAETARFAAVLNDAAQAS